MELDKVIEALCARLQLDATEFIASLKESDGKFKNDTPELVAGLVSDALQTGKTQQHQRGTREANEQARKFMKSKGFDAPKDVQGKDLWEAYEAWREEESQSAGGKKPDEMTPAELAKLPAVKTLLQERIAENQRQYEALETEFNTFKKGEHAKSVRSIGESMIPALIEAKGGLLDSPATGVPKEKRLASFYKTLPWDRMQVEGEGDKRKIVMLDENGDVLKDSAGRPVSFESTVVSTWGEIHGFVKQDPSKGSPSPKPVVNADGTAKMSFVDAKDFDRQIANEPDSAKRLNMRKAYNEQVLEVSADDGQ